MYLGKGDVTDTHKWKCLYLIFFWRVGGGAKKVRRVQLRSEPEWLLFLPPRSSAEWLRISYTDSCFSCSICCFFKNIFSLPQKTVALCLTSLSPWLIFLFFSPHPHTFTSSFLSDFRQPKSHTTHLPLFSLFFFLSPSFFFYFFPFFQLVCC